MKKPYKKVLSARVELAILGYLNILPFVGVFLQLQDRWYETYALTN